MQRLHIDGSFGRLRFRVVAEDTGRAFEQLTLPLGDLVGMDIKLLCRSKSVFSPFNAAKATFTLNAGV